MWHNQYPHSKFRRLLMCLSIHIVTIIHLKASVKYQLVNKCRAMSSSAVVWPLSASTSVFHATLWWHQQKKQQTQTPWSFRLPSLPQCYYALTPPVVHLALATSARRQTPPLLTPQVSGLFPHAAYPYVSILQGSSSALAGKAGTMTTKHPCTVSL